MKIQYKPLWLGLLALLALTSAAPAQDTKASTDNTALGVPTPPAAQTPASPDMKASAPAAPATVAEPAPTPAAPEASTPPSAPAAPAAETSPAPDDKKSDLRRLDEQGSTAPSQDNRTKRRGGPRIVPPRVHIHHGGGNDRVGLGQDVTLAQDETVDDVVAVLGSAKAEGTVNGSVVAVLGNSRAAKGAGDSVVAVLGSAYVNGKVGDAVVAIMGDVELGPDADIGGDVVSIGGKVQRDPKAVVHGTVQNIGALGGELRHQFDGLLAWFRNCLMKFRLLGFAPGLEWAWGVATAFLVLYVLLALLFRGGIEKCAETLETRPGYSVLAAVLTVLLAPIAIVLLCFTVVGIAVVPFLAVGLFLATLFGKATMLAWIGRRLTKFFGDGPLAHPAVAVLIGGLIVMILYTIPIVGVLTYKLLGWLGLGVAVYTLILSTRRERPPAAPITVPVAPAPVPVAAMGGASMGVASMGMAAGVPEFATAAAGAPEAAGMASLPPPIAAPAVSAIALPRAGFWLRIGGLALDALIVALVLMFVPHGFGFKFYLLALAAYGAVMWKVKGTTIGGIVCGLKVVRTDGRDLDWTTAIVRALSCFLSLAVVGLGFIWVVIDSDRQSWHDKIAGTAVVHVPKGMALV